MPRTTSTLGAARTERPNHDLLRPSGSQNRYHPLPQKGRKTTMKLSAILCASFVTLAALAMTAESTLAAKFAVNAKRLDPYASTAVKDCTDAGGIVSTAKDGTKTCTTPSPACKASGKSNTSEKIDTNDATAVAACFEVCGTIAPAARVDINRGVWKAPAGICTKPVQGAVGPAPH